jgi:hypothetical protein
VNLESRLKRLEETFRPNTLWDGASGEDFARYVWAENGPDPDRVLAPGLRRMIIWAGLPGIVYDFHEPAQLRRRSAPTVEVEGAESKAQSWRELCGIAEGASDEQLVARLMAWVREEGFTSAEMREARQSVAEAVSVRDKGV